MASGQSDITTCDEDGCFQEAIEGSAKCGKHDPERMKVLLAAQKARHSDAGPPQTLDQLNAKIVELFHCMDGPPVAYFEIPIENGVVEGAVERFTYVTLGWITSGERTPPNEAQLVKAMLEPFIAARRKLVGDAGNDEVFKPLLFWRRRIAIYEDGDKQLKIQCRVVIPGVDLTDWGKDEGALYRRV
ncbi:MAG TPA: hypothetical protein VLH80_07330 [Nitrospiraceae bacterium]|nr:hypothetical protein [Nitrospiraceae bacterium]